MRHLFAGRTLIAVATALVLTACATGTAPRRSAESPSLRCVNEPGRGQSTDSSRPLFFLFCAQSP
ncbi:MAG TPA: hypothetical protein VFO08_01105 [Methylomirabilota bacterium]|nr:hypothetical protein [Methylomirabilota bacterium]